MSEHKNSVYKKISEEIEKRIISGEYPAGSRIEPERKLMELYGVERMTVRRALDVLVKQGLIVKKTGLGSFVADGGTETAESKLSVNTRSDAANNKKIAVRGKEAHKNSFTRLSELFILKKDYCSAARVIRENLEELGHERIAFVGSLPEFFSAFAGEMAKSGKYDKEIYVLTSDAKETGYAFEKLYRGAGASKPTAVVTSTKKEAEDIAGIAEALRIDIPSELSVVSAETDLKSGFSGCVFDQTDINDIVSRPVDINLTGVDRTKFPATVLAAPMFVKGETISVAAAVNKPRGGMSDYLL